MPLRQLAKPTVRSILGAPRWPASLEPMFQAHVRHAYLAGQRSQAGAGGKSRSQLGANTIGERHASFTPGYCFASSRLKRSCSSRAKRSATACSALVYLR